MKIESSWLKIINLLVVLGTSLSSGAVALAGSGGPLASDVQVTILSSNLANGATVGEWGFSTMVGVFYLMRDVILIL